MAIKNENYIVIQGWMVSKLKLKGNELLVYSIIYGFSQVEHQMFTGSIKYLQEWTNATKKTIITTLQSLVEKGLLDKYDTFKNGVRYCSYNAIVPGENDLNKEQGGVKITPGVKKLHQGGEKITPGVVKKLHQGGEKITPNNIYNNINNNIDNNIENIYVQKVAHECFSSTPKENKENEIIKNEFNKLWKLYPRKIGKAKALEYYTKYRQAKDDSYTTYDEVLSGIEKYNEFIKQEKFEERYIKAGSTFFISKAWLDEYPIKEYKTTFDFRDLEDLYCNVGMCENE